MSRKIDNQFPCEVTMDLLPLYADEMCSDMSKQLVEQHLEGCENCKAELALIRNDIFGDSQCVQESKNTSYTMKQAMKRVRRKWACSILVTMLVVSGSVVTICKVTGNGIELGRCYETMVNTGNYIKAKKIEKAMMSNEFEKVLNYMNIEEMYERATEKDMGLEVFEKQYKQQFVSNLEELIKEGYQFTEVKCINWKREHGQNSIKFAITYEKNEGKQQYIDFMWLDEVDGKFVCSEYERKIDGKQNVKNAFCFK